MQVPMEYIVKDETAMLERWFQCGSMSSLGRKVSSTSPPLFDAVSLSFTPASAAGKSTRLTPNVADRFNYKFVEFSMCFLAAGFFVKAVRPNLSLNRTHCSVPSFGLKKPSPNASPPQWAG